LKNFSRIKHKSLLSIFFIFLLSLLIAPVFNRVIPESLKPSTPRDYINFYFIGHFNRLSHIGSPNCPVGGDYPGWVGFCEKVERE